MSRSGASPARPDPVLGLKALIWKQLMANGFSDQGARLLADALLAGLGLVPFANQFQALSGLSLYDQRQAQLLQQGLRQGDPSALAVARAAAELQGDAREAAALAGMLDDMIAMALQRLVGAANRFAGVLDGVGQMVDDKGASSSQGRFSA